MANEVFINKGAELLISGASGADYAWSVEGLTNGAGRVSAQIDLGDLPRPEEYEWSCELQFQATPTQGLGLEIYKAGAPDSDPTQIDGDVGASDAALGDVDMRRNLQHVGYVVSENAAASEPCVSSGRFRHTKRYLSLVAYDASGAAVNATDTNFIFKLRAVYPQAQP